jgi:hypothetical protein
MKRVVLYRDNWAPEAFTEGDLVTLRPCSLEKWNKRIDGNEETYRYSWINHSTLMERRTNLFWEKYILARIQYVTIDYWHVVWKIDFVRPNRDYFWCHMYPIGRGYNYVDTNHFDMIKILDCRDVTSSEKFRELFKNAINSNTIGWVQRQQVVTQDWLFWEWKDISLTKEKNIIDRVTIRRKERAIRNAMATPEEVMERNVYPN